MEERKFTVPEVLEMTVNLLQSIALPVTLSETAGAAICGSIRNLNACIAVMKKEMKAEEEKHNE